MKQDYQAITRGIAVSVQAFYLDDQSRPEENHFLWVYRVRIENRGRVAVQLLKRSWEIIDARGRVQRVHGDGVVGEQPVIQPNGIYEYQSGTPLATPSGVMTGLYHMIEADSLRPFDVQIPSFSLDSPYQSGSVH